MQSIDKTINRLTKWKNENVSIQEMTDIFYNQILTQATPSDLKKLENGLQKTWVLGVGGGASVRYFPSSLHPVHLCMDYNLFTHQLQKITLRDTQNRTEYFLIGGKKACEELRQELLYLIHSSPEKQSANPLPHSFAPNVKRKGGKFASSPSHSSKSITRFLSIAVILLLIACIWLFLQSTEIGSSIYNRFFMSKPEWIETVQNGFLGEYTDMRVYDLLWNYRLTYEKEEWDGGTTSTGKRIAEVRFSNPGSEATTTIQFEMFDDDVFRVSAFVDPQMPSAKGTDIMYALNAAYYSGICMEYLDDMEKTDAVNQLLQTVFGSEVLYGASVSYTGDRSNLHLLWQHDKLDMSTADLLSAYGLSLIEAENSVEQPTAVATAPQIENYIPYSADELLQILEQNMSSAQQQFLGKYILLTGELHFTGSDSDFIVVDSPNATYDHHIQGQIQDATLFRSLIGANEQDIIQLNCVVTSVDSVDGYTVTIHSIVDVSTPMHSSTSVTEPPSLQTTPQDILIGTVQWSIDVLNVRSGPGTSYSIAARLNPGDIIPIYEQRTIGNTVWGQTDSGWVCMDYITFGQQPVAAPQFDSSILNEYCGTWWDINSKRCNMTINRAGNALQITINWSSGASSSTIWEFTGEYDYSEGVVYYWNGVCKDIVSDELLGLREFIKYTNGEGIILLRDGRITWMDGIEHAGDSCLFSKE